MAPKFQDLSLKLVAVSGAERPIILRLGANNIEIRSNQTAKKPLEVFEYERLLKWTNASKRSGPPECLDIQVHTDKGPRDLRFKCSSEDGAEKLSSILTEKLSEIFEKRKKSGKFKNSAKKIVNARSAITTPEKPQSPAPQELSTNLNNSPMQQTPNNKLIEKISASVINDIANTKLDITLIVSPEGLALAKGSTNQILGKYKYKEALKKCLIDTKDVSSFLLVVRDKQGKDQQLKVKPNDPNKNPVTTVVDTIKSYLGESSPHVSSDAISSPSVPAEDSTSNPTSVTAHESEGANSFQIIAEKPLSEPSSPVPPPPPSNKTPTKPPSPPSSIFQTQPQQQEQHSASDLSLPPTTDPAITIVELQRRLAEAESRLRQAEIEKTEFESRAQRAASRLADIEAKFDSGNLQSSSQTLKVKALEDELSEKAKDLAHAKTIANNLEIELADARKDVDAVLKNTAGANFSTASKTHTLEENAEIRRMQAFIARMQEGLVERDGRMIRLERKYKEERSQRKLLEDKLQESMLHNKRITKEIEEKEREIQATFLSDNGGGYIQNAQEEVSLALLNKALTNSNQIQPHMSLRREGLKLAKNECARLEREREELCDMNGKLLLRLGGMETTISRLKQSLKIEDAANKLIC